MSSVHTDRPPRFEAGDGLRALAALSVLVHHAARRTGSRSGELGDPFSVFGSVGAHLLAGLQAGLFIFFALSGYLLGRPFARALVRGAPLPSISRYARSRFLRIVPAFWVVWAITLFVHGTKGASTGDIVALFGFGQVYLDPTPVAALMLQAWTLDVEMAFYIMLPLAALGLALLLPRLPKTWSRATWLLLAVGGAALVSLAFRDAWANPAWKSTLPEYLVAFTPGLALAVAEQVWARRARDVDAVRRLVPALIALAVGAYVWYAYSRTGSAAIQTLTGTLTGGLVVAAGLVREWSTGSALRPFAHPVAVWLGERSYGIYLVHILILGQIASVADDIATPGVALVVRAVVLAALSVLAAAILFRFVERPALDLRTRDRKPPRPTEPEMAAP